MDGEPSDAIPLAAADEVRTGERTGPGLEGLCCPGCSRHYRVRAPASAASYRCPCGRTFRLADLSVRLGGLAPEDRDRTRRLLAQLGLPTAAPAGVSAERLRGLMGVDKKVRAGRLRLVLLRALGDALLTDAFDAGALDETLRDCREDG